MKTRLTPHYISLVYEACLKSFWRRKALAKFLRQCDVSESFLRSWAPDESKREVLDRLFLELPKSDRGRSGLVRMAGFLMEQDSFPDLKNWENSAAKLKEAQDAVSQLRRYHSKQQEEIQSEEDKIEARKRFAERQRQASQSQQTLQSLSDRLNDLDEMFGVIRTQGRSLELTEDRFWNLGYGSDTIHLVFNLWYREFNYTPAYENNLPQVDHIFPRSRLKETRVVNPETGRKVMKYRDGARNQLANCMLLTREENGGARKRTRRPTNGFQTRVRNISRCT